MPKFMTAPPGTNPMEMPELIQRKRTTLKQKLLIIGVATLLMMCVCIAPAVYFTKSKPAKAVITTPVATLTNTITNTARPTGITPTQTSTVTPTGTNTPSGYPTLPGPSVTPMATQTPIVITHEVTRVVNVANPYPVPVITIMVVTIEVTVKETVVITTTPLATQTPWIITVEVTPTSTPTPSITPTIAQIDTQIPTQIEILTEP